VLTNRTCGHIVFVDNVAAHRWVVQTLVEAGIPEARIAVLNARSPRRRRPAAHRPRVQRRARGRRRAEVRRRDRQRHRLRGHRPPDRTCAIHHLDLPWEPATLQQRNGRGVRQGNTLANIEINYYFARRSQDGLRFNLIQGKLGWMTELLKSQRATRTTPARRWTSAPRTSCCSSAATPRRPPRRLAEVKARREAEARRRRSPRTPRAAAVGNARFRKAERTEDPTEAARLRLEGEERLKDLANVDPSAWPWARWMYAAREHDLLVPRTARRPVYEGLRVGVPSPWNPDKVQHVEFGRVKGTAIGVREAGTATWTERTIEKVAAFKLQPEHLDPAWPDEEREAAQAADRGASTRRCATAATGRRSGGRWASDAWLSADVGEARGADRAAAGGGVELVRGAAAGAGGRARVLRVVRGVQIGGADGRAAADAGGVAAVPGAGAGVGAEVHRDRGGGVYWWDRKIPRTGRTPSARRRI
jgi:hypothetical protein